MPRRRCVGCGRIAPKAELLRIAVAHDGTGACKRAVIDRDATMPGRGAYLCRAGAAGAPTTVNRACLKLASRRRGIARALRAAVTLDTELVESPEGGQAGRRAASRSSLFFIES